ncbi:MAG TPA: CBS domain-containing protein [Kofleriaceae bacterium]|nr:CBS domain-containing protein [Kofleriaceae bacterium]
MRVSDLMGHPAITCRVQDNLSVPARLMWDHDCGVVPVVREDGKLVGVITDRDICMAAYTQGHSLGEIDVSTAMAPHPISVRADQEIEEAERVMAEHQVRRIPVVDDDGRPVGVLSLNDLALEGVRPDTRIENACVRIAHTLAAVCTHRPGARTPTPRDTETPIGEIAPAGWYENFVEPYSMPAGAAELEKAGAA